MADNQQHYTGSCQCEAVKFEVELDLTNPVICNCSRCKKMGFVLSFTGRDKLKLLSGADNLAEYLFNKKQIQHLFCKTCGVQSFAYGAMPDGTPIAAVNLNCLDGVDARALECQQYDGAST
ncbi:GFA family protein [Catenovulum sp. 2E275]|uniref:GFA family protein n=1 Tax=Catenovulum sp. 2E275 TaxID=2980497 RepID=UPI0021D312C0|nr:GFA family protein [Catenovulum sp. 2E275]MCU4675210.1 GFA family protein [Catenovulum sp. 2E275]